ncbi:MAG TPA: biotin--[acetyl-CoA-carboxylase] ligase [Egibacteraceae bacterium]|nr:biotin--[acetyl-CoA-carboxylase] ligase [Egibacteraceae bacterium]
MQPADGDDLSPDRVAAALGPDASLGRPVQHYGVAVSAESLALGWARQHDAPEGALVVADVELSARGRRGQTWVSRAGRSLAFSVVLRPGLPPAGEGLLWLLASLAAAEGLEAVTDLDVRLKWPNDLLVGGRGIGGIRIDAHLGPGSIESAVVTVRVNVGLHEDDFPAELRGGVTSLAMEGAQRARSDVLAAVLDRLAARYEAGVASLLDDYRARCETIGTRVRALLMPTGEAVGLAADVDDHGALVLETPGGRGGIGVDRVQRLERA